MRGIKNLLLSQLTYSQYQHHVRISYSIHRYQADMREHAELKRRYRDVKDRATAENLVHAILEHREDPTAPVLHVEAGSGLVCQEFLKRGISTVIALDSSKSFMLMADYKSLENEYGAQRFQYLNWPMLSLSLKLGGGGEGQGKSSYSRAEEYVSQLLQQKTRPGTGHAIVNIGSKNVKYEYYDFLFYILRNMPNDDPIISGPGVEFFFLAHPRFKSKLEFLADIETATQSLRYSYMMAATYLLYDTSFIGKFDAKAFIPPFKTIKAVQDPEDVDPNVRLLVKLRLKENIETILPLDHHVSFFIFLRQLYTKKVNRTIPTMEMLVPGCGLRMVALDFTMMDTILRTQPERFLSLYRHMVHWPEYQSSPLRNFILQKTRGGLDHWPESDIVKDHKTV